MYLENHSVNIFNSLKVNNLASIVSNDVIKYGFNIPKVILFEIHLQNIQNQSFSSVGVRLWNEIPQTIRKLPKCLFKKTIKSYPTSFIMCRVININSSCYYPIKLGKWS